MMAFPMVFISYFLGVIGMFAKLTALLKGTSSREVMEKWEEILGMGEE
ncbi:MAG: hypothetical protein IK118_06500 [Clostridia bacterium]|nr:hypothetical protein [Clostridia bacterium]